MIILAVIRCYGTVERIRGGVVQLSNETDFMLGGWFVRPSLGHVEVGARVDRLEPQVMRVLIALARCEGQTVNREQLITEAWNGRVVTDDAVGRCIRQLRRVLEDEQQATVRIVTVPKIGYRLVIDDGADSAIPGMTLSSKPSSRLWAWGSVGAVVVAVSLGAYFYLQQTGSQLEQGAVNRIRPLTTDVGLEVDPAISPAGGTVAYSAQSDAGNWDLFVRAVDTDSALRLTHHTARDHRPAWSADGGRLLFVREDHETISCGLYVIAATGGVERKVGDCSPGGVRSIDWAANGKQVAIVENAAGFASGGRILDLKSGVSVEIEKPLGAALGIEDLRFSPDGQRLAYTAAFGLGAEDLFERDLASGETTRLSFDHLKIHGLAWTPDGDGIVYTSNRGGPFSLWQIAADGGEPLLLPAPFRNADGVSIAGTGRLVVDEWREQSDLAWVDILSGEISSADLSGSLSYEWGGAISPDSQQVAFVSDRSGAAEIWIAGIDGSELRRMTEFAGAYVQAPRWSPDGLRLSFSAPIDGVYQLFIVEVVSGELSTVTAGEVQFQAPTWSPDSDSLFAVAMLDGAPSAVAVDIKDGSVSELGIEGARFVWLDPSGDTLYFVRSDAAGLWRAMADKSGWSRPEVVVDDLGPVDAENWFVEENAVFFVSRRFGEPPRLVRQDLANTHRSDVAEINDFLYKSGLSYEPRTRRALVTRITEQESDIYVADGLIGP